RYLLEGEAAKHASGHDPQHKPSLGERFFARFEHAFTRLRTSYGGLLAWSLENRVAFVAAFLVFVVASVVALMPLLGRDFFPTVDAGLIKLHARGAPGLRIEESEKRFGALEDTIHSVIPEAEIATMIDNIGVPNSGINLSLSEGALISPSDGQILISLKEGHKPTADYVRALRKKLHRDYPESTFFFLAPDISTQVLNFGLAAPIDVQVVGAPGKEADTLAVTRNILAQMKLIPGAVDVHMAQVLDKPELRIDVDRTMASMAGLTQKDVASDILVSLSSSTTVAPSFWLDTKRSVQYSVAVQTPQYENNSVDAVNDTPLSTGGDLGPQLLSNVAAITRTVGPANITHYNAARTYDVQANVDGTDLGAVATAVSKIVSTIKPNLPRGTTIKVKGQVESMESSFTGLGYGLIFSVVLVYLLMVVNFQSWLDPLVILMALPGAIAGIVWMLFLSHTTLSVPALMGSIMCVGVATANSILVVTFANDQRKVGRDAKHAALAAGMTRLRPVIMTALAMIIGMLPMSLGLGEGGEQNAPLGRAVIGGLLFATLATLFFVPVMYSALRRKAPTTDPMLEDL
ncbi:MAG TPA: efflux RND transporter permease subunit, partial [Polyangiaceae bacterium]|nr:efflux RND transporter permease subunit [Polyangiaceae bacterium]